MDTIVPITKLRNFYDSLARLGLSTNTQLSIVKDINRENKYKRLIYLYEESKNFFSEYDNINEPFLPENLDHRKNIPDFDKIEIISNTHDVISVLQKGNPEIKVVDHSNYNFEYIQREVPTSRITNTKSKAGRKSGAGGIDFIGLTCKQDKLPILGEIKVAGDQNSFYALIQLLTYLSELYTPNQIKRINNTKLYGSDYNFMPSATFYLYVLLVFTDMGEWKKDLLRETKTLAECIARDINEIEEIVFLKMHPETKKITKI